MLSAGSWVPTMGSFVSVPVVLHAYNYAALVLGFFVQRLRELADLGIRQPLTRRSIGKSSVESDVRRILIFASVLSMCSPVSEDSYQSGLRVHLYQHTAHRFRIAI